MIEYATKWNTTLVDPKHPALHGECTVNPLDTDIVWQTVEQEMFKLMHERIGIGLAAPQLGNPVKMFVMTHSQEGDIAVYNPKIVNVSEETISMEEGCLTFPGLFFHLRRKSILNYLIYNKVNIFCIFLTTRPSAACHLMFLHKTSIFSLERQDRRNILTRISLSRSRQLILSHVPCLWVPDRKHLKYHPKQLCP